MNLPWTLKYKPVTLSEVVGNKKAKDKILEWLREWKDKPPKKRCLLLHGSSGIGKTVTVEAVAKDLDMELAQSNASNYRTGEEVKAFAGLASQYNSLFGKKRLILFDELEGITGTSDRGGPRAILEVIKQAWNPIILITNNVYNVRFSTLKKYCEIVPFRKPTSRQIQKHLMQICNLEGIEAEEEAIKFIAQKTEGDIRSAINDLQALAQGRRKLKYNHVVWLKNRERKESIFNVLKKIFYAKNSLDAKVAFNSAEIDSDMLLEWIYENIPYQIKDPKELATAVDMISLADIYRGRIRRTQQWKLLKYFIDFITAGIATSWNQKSSGWIPFRFPSRIMAMSHTRKIRSIQDSIGVKIGKKCHISKKHAKKDVIPYIRVIFKSNEEMRKGLSRWLDLDEEMIGYLSK